MCCFSYRTPTLPQPTHPPITQPRLTASGPILSLEEEERDFCDTLARSRRLHEERRALEESSEADSAQPAHGNGASFSCGDALQTKRLQLPCTVNDGAQPVR